MKKIVASIAMCGVCVAGCTDAGWERATAYGNKHKVTMYSGGKQVATWTSTGYPQSLTSEDGWQFKDEASGNLIIVTGDLVIEKLPD